MYETTSDKYFPKEIWAANRNEPNSALSYRCLSESVTEVKKTGEKVDGGKKRAGLKVQILGLIGQKGSQL